MADPKISQLNAITVLTPATDVLPVVDSGGVTKKITTNQILGSGGTATLASATITGDLTVDTSTLKVDSTNNRVGIGTATPGETLDVKGTGNFNNTSGTYLGFQTNAAQVGYIGTANTILTGGLNTELGLWANSTLKIATGASALERYKIDSTGISTWSVAGTTAMTLNSTGLGVKGTIGTSSGDAVIAFGTRGVIVGNAASAIASASYIDITVVTGGEGYQGFLSVANTVDASANLRTQTTYSVFGRGTSSTITQIATANGSSGGASFTVTTPSNGVIRITNTSGLAATISAQFFGGTSA